MVALYNLALSGRSMKHRRLYRAICGLPLIAAAGHELHVNAEQTAVGVQQRLLRCYQMVALCNLAHVDFFCGFYVDRAGGNWLWFGGGFSNP